MTAEQWTSIVIVYFASLGAVFLAGAMYGKRWQRKTDARLALVQAEMDRRAAIIQAERQAQTDQKIDPETCEHDLRSDPEGWKRTPSAGLDHAICTIFGVTPTQEEQVLRVVCSKCGKADFRRRVHRLTKDWPTVNSAGQINPAPKPRPVKAKE